MGIVCSIGEMFKKIKKASLRFWTKSPRANWSAIRRKVFKIENPNYRQVWCLSTGRVGTQTLSELGNLLPSCASVHEPWPSFYELSRQAYELSIKGADRSVLLAALKGGREELVKEYSPSSYLETSPQVTFLAPELKQAFTDCKFIHVVRHPADVVRSGMRRKWYQDAAFDDGRIRPLQGSVAEEWSAMDAFSKNLWLWCETNRWIENYLSKLPEGDWVRLRAEDLFSGKEETLQTFYEIIGGATPKVSKIRAVLGLKLNSQQGGEYPRLAAWDDSQKELLEKWGGDLMKLYGY